MSEDSITALVDDEITMVGFSSTRPSTTPGLYCGEVFCTVAAPPFCASCNHHRHCCTTSSLPPPLLHHIFPATATHHTCCLPPQEQVQELFSGLRLLVRAALRTPLQKMKYATLACARWPRPRSHSHRYRRCLPRPSWPFSIPSPNRLHCYHLLHRPDLALLTARCHCHCRIAGRMCFGTTLSLLK